MNKVEQIKNAIKLAEENKSKLLNTGAFELPSFTGNKIRHLLNNLGAISTKYFECGLHKAGTFISALYQNELMGVGVDNWSQFQEGGASRELAYLYCKMYLEHERYKLLERDCWDVKPSDISGVDMFNYDGNHAKEFQKNALIHFKPMMADEFIYVCDDYGWKDVKEGTQEGIKEAGYEVLFSQELGTDKGNDGDGYWNGILVALLRKK
jgi:hypothetical protein